VIDKKPRPVTEEQIEDLKDLASVVMDQLELGLSARQAVGKANLMGKEIDHRVMNSLQFVSGLLTMQSRSPEVGDASNHLKQAANRVAAVAQVHRHFYVDAEEEVSCIAYLRRLCGDLADILDREIVVDGDEAMVPAASIQPIGLLTNELVTNAAKHGAGKIEVLFEVRGHANCLSVCDEGTGLKPDFDPHSSTAGLGMRVITTLVRQLHGTFSAGPRAAGEGACFSVEFPAAARVH
jgi:two-component sensor histidine kinase